MQEHMNDAGWGALLTNVFVLMLENHSFDNIFAMSGIPGIQVATLEDSNLAFDKKYFVRDGAPWSMTTDPGHEFVDVLEQLCGRDAAHNYRGGAYPPVNNSGFASNYATSTSESTGMPTPAHVGDIMACFDTRRQLPVIHQLASEFAICDQWFSSIPGPTVARNGLPSGNTDNSFTQARKRTILPPTSLRVRSGPTRMT
jgi:phospholipase C